MMINIVVYMICFGCFIIMVYQGYGAIKQYLDQPHLTQIEYEPATTREIDSGVLCFEEGYNKAEKIDDLTDEKKEQLLFNAGFSLKHFKHMYLDENGIEAMRSKIKDAMQSFLKSKAEYEHFLRGILPVDEAYFDVERYMNYKRESPNHYLSPTYYHSRISCTRTKVRETWFGYDDNTQFRENSTVSRPVVPENSEGRRKMMISAYNPPDVNHLNVRFYAIVTPSRGTWDQWIHVNAEISKHVLLQTSKTPCVKTDEDDENRTSFKIPRSYYMEQCSTECYQEV